MRTSSRRIKGFKPLDTAPEDETRRVQPVEDVESEIEDADKYEGEESSINEESDDYDAEPLEDDYDPEEERRARVAKLNRTICIVLCILVLVAGVVLVAQNAGSSSKDGAEKSANKKSALDEKPAPTFTTTTNSLVNASDWTITNVSGSYRANGKRIMGNYTLRDENDNVQYLSNEEKKALGEALNKHEELHPPKK